jgi:RED-like protein N-terminal region
MNNSQFRKLVLDTPARQSGLEKSGNLGTAPKRDGTVPLALGSRMRSSIPMTPYVWPVNSPALFFHCVADNILHRRSVAIGGGVDFARQLAERERASGNQPTRKFRSSAAPKGAKLPAGYIDRTKERVSDDDDEKASRVKALEEMVKLQQIDQATFEKLRDEIIGGDVGSVHLVKGLDYKLLERVRRGEDVLNGGSKTKYDGEDEDAGFDIDEELEKLEDREVAPVVKEKSEKKGEMAPPSLVPGKKRNRDQILAELKAARQAAKEKAVPTLGARFKKVGVPQTGSRIEKDSKGREVLITVDADGNEKRKVRRVQLEQKVEKGHGLLMPDKDSKPLGMEVPEIPKPAEEEDEEIDIFEDVGDDYNPLAEFEDENEESEAEDSETSERKTKNEKEVRPSTARLSAESSTAPPLGSEAPAKPRNYFRESKETTSETSISAGAKAMEDPTIFAALKKASALASHSETVKTEEQLAREAKLKKLLEAHDRDAADMDMGFGSSRLEDEEDFGDEKIKLSEWGADRDDDAEKGSGKGKRKRGPKKRKGDVNSAADVMKVLERRKAANG